MVDISKVKYLMIGLCYIVAFILGTIVESKVLKSPWHTMWIIPLIIGMMSVAIWAVMR